jgi:DNA-binding transcriptional regulator GbsR (MarR family)
MEKIQIVEVKDTVYEETYTAHIQKNGAVWMGWIPEVPKVECQENTQEALLEMLEKKLHETLVAEDEAWEKQLEENVKAGHLDHLLEKAEKNFKAGRYYKIEDLQKLLEK